MMEIPLRMAPIGLIHTHFFLFKRRYGRSSFPMLA
jgi:hypothetical protein